MKYHDDNDALEAFFRQHLEGYAEDPPPVALDSIQQRLAQRRKRRWGWAAWAGLLMLGIVAVGGLLFWERNQSEKIESLERRLAAAQQSGDGATNGSAPHDSHPFQANADKELRSKNVKATNLDANYKGRKTKPAQHFNHQKNLQVEIAEGNAALAGSINGAELVVAEAETWFSKNESQETPTLLPTGNLQQFESLHHVPSGVAIGKSNPAKLISGEAYLAHLPLNGGNSLGAGNRWQVGLMATIVEHARWSLSLGLEYGVYEPAARHQTGTPWVEQALLTDPEGNQYTNYSTVMNTSFGESILHGRLQYFPAGDSLDLLGYDYLRTTTTARTRIEMLSLPLIMRWQFGKGPLNCHLKGGFGVANIIRQSTSFESSIEANERPGRYRLTSFYSDEISNKLQRALFQAYFGLGATWQLNQHHSILIEPTAVLALSKLSQGQSTRHWALGLQVGVRRRF